MTWVINEKLSLWTNSASIKVLRGFFFLKESMCVYRLQHWICSFIFALWAAKMLIRGVWQQILINKVCRQTELFNGSHTNLSNKAANVDFRAWTSIMNQCSSAHWRIGGLNLSHQKATLVYFHAIMYNVWAAEVFPSVNGTVEAVHSSLRSVATKVCWMRTPLFCQHGSSGRLNHVWKYPERVLCGQLTPMPAVCIW